MSKHYAVISIGTNSTRVLLADVAPEMPHVDLARSIGTRIGEGLGQSGELGAEPMRRTYDAIRQLLRAVRGHYVKLFAVSTSAVRRATNGNEFAAGVQGILGVPLRVLSGDEEASCAYRGAITAFGARDAQSNERPSPHSEVSKLTIAMGNQRSRFRNETDRPGTR